MNLTVAVFTFNTEAQIFCCSCDKQERCDLSKKFLSYTSSNCIPNDFVKQFVDHVKNANDGNLPDLFVINLQESSIVNPIKGFRSDQLLFAFEKCITNVSSDYVLKREKLQGIGAEGIRGLRTGLITNKLFNTHFKFYFYKPLFESKIKISEGQQFGKGAILLELKIQKDHKNYHLHFINTHLPFLPNTKDQGKNIRDRTIQETLEAFNNKIKENTNITNIAKFVVGDLNYRIEFQNDETEKNKFLELFQGGTSKTITIEAPETIEVSKTIEIPKTTEDFNINDYKKFDQLQNVDALNNYKEGIDNDGPNFLPTCKLKKDCKSTNRPYQIIKGDTLRIPSWCDRILYLGDNIKCLLYENFDRGQTCMSDHIPVIGLYKITPTPQIGGNDFYYNKYIKYKQKYLSLKHTDI
jgi:hypothetical protein